ncbi:hypothetical protein ACFX1R_014561 [Malus domestica]
MFQIVHKVKATRVALTKWQNRVFNSRKTKISDIRAKLGNILHQPLSENSVSERATLMNRLDSLLGDVESFWGQRSHLH